MKTKMRTESQTKTHSTSSVQACQNCKKDFTIEPDDFGFYEKIKVPPPTFCPECRLKRRTSWRNDWHIFQKKDLLTGKFILSLFPEESPVRIYDRDYWISDAWDPISYGKDYDFSRPFFEQLKELMHKVPFPAHSMNSTVVNSRYCANASFTKNCYFCRGIAYTEDSSYLIWDQASKNCLDSHMTNSCELSYGNVNTITCYGTFFSVDCESSQSLILCKDCVGCNDCVASSNLRNKSYCIFNQEYSRDEYKNKLKEFDLGSYEKFETLKNLAYKHWLKYPNKYMHSRQNVNSTGDYIYESKNTIQSYRIRETEDSKFVQNILTGPVRDCYDYTNWGDNAELVYESMIVGEGASNVKFCWQAFSDVKDLYYCIFCHNTSDCFGCVSLRKKKYCILNKQYPKEEYEKLLPKIIDHMKSTGEYGEFFPAAMSPFPYQISQAGEFFPMTEKEATKQGFTAYDTKKQNYEITLKNKNIPDNINDIALNTVDEVIECSHQGKCAHECTGAFRVIESEITFCKRMNISLPRKCPNCRHYERLTLRNLPVFYHRQCMCDKSGHFHGAGKCEVEFETSYAPERPEIVYCEKCYQQEVY